MPMSADLLSYDVTCVPGTYPVTSEPNLRASLANLLMVIGPSGKRPKGTELRKLEMRFGLRQPDVVTNRYHGPITPILGVAPIRRSSSGSNAPIIEWVRMGPPGHPLKKGLSPVTAE